MSPVRAVSPESLVCARSSSTRALVTRMPRSGADSDTDICNIPYRCRERSNWALPQEMLDKLQKVPPMRQISVGAWTRNARGN